MPRRDVTIACPVCGAASSALVPRCASCGAFVQDRVPALNLFATVLGLVEAPAETFRRIARSEQKNYVYGLFAAQGPLLLALVFAVARTGDSRVHFGLQFLALFALGPLFGVGTLTMAAWLLGRANALLWKLRLPLRDTASMLAYALVPVLGAGLVVLPVQLGLFGAYLFSLNPAPWMLKPTPFWALLAVDGVLIVWALLLWPLSFRTFGLSRRQGIVTMVPALCVVAGLIIAAGFGLAALLAA